MPTPEQPAPAEEVARLVIRFEETRQFKLWQEFLSGVKYHSHSTGPTAEMPAGFLRLAAEQIRDPNHYPLTFPVLERAFNRLVGELGLPASYRMPPQPDEPEEDTPDADDELEDELYEKFEASEEYRRWREFAAALDGIEDSGGQTVDVPTAFLRIATVDLEQQPFRFDVLRSVWNRLVDEMDLSPDLKKGTP